MSRITGGVGAGSRRPSLREGTNSSSGFVSGIGLDAAILSSRLVSNFRCLTVKLVKLTQTS